MSGGSTDGSYPGSLSFAQLLQSLVKHHVKEKSLMFLRCTNLSRKALMPHTRLYCNKGREVVPTEDLDWQHPSDKEDIPIELMRLHEGKL